MASDKARHLDKAEKICFNTLMSINMSRGEFVSGLFGRAYKVDVWQAVLRFATDPPEPFCMIELQRPLEVNQGINRASTAIEVKSMLSYGMIEPIPRSLYPDRAAPQSVYYVRTESIIWDMVREAIRVVEEQFPVAE